MASWMPTVSEPQSICILCEGPYRCPVSLACGHIFCRGCLEGRRLPTPGQDLLCPSCGSYTRFGKDGTSRPEIREPGGSEAATNGMFSHTWRPQMAHARPQVNHEQLRTLERRAAQSCIPCLVCEVIPPREAVKSCLQCKLSYCGSCLEHLHPYRGSLIQHQLTNPRIIFNPPEKNLCEIHKEKLSLYCSECQKLSCLVCERIGKHKHHRLIDVKTAYQHIQVEMRSKYNYLQSRIEKIKCDLRKMESVHKTEKRIVGQFQDRMSSSYDGLMRVIAERKAVVLQKSNQKLDSVSNHVISNTVSLKGTLDDNQRCEALLAKNFQESNEVNFLKAAPALKMRLDSSIRLSHQTEKHTSHTPVRSEDACADILLRGYYNITITDCTHKDNSVTLKVKNGRLSNSSCAVQ